jgi:nucleoside-diphosphate-sugar epimerase
MKTVAVTGGNGKIGKAVLRNLGEHGYRTANLSRGKRREDVADQYFVADLLDAGSVYGALSRCGADAVVHLGTLGNPKHHPGYEVFRSNAMSTYHVLEVATALRLESACLASSISAMGYTFQADPIEVQYLPVDENHPATPRDPYALGKRIMEVTAEGFGRLQGASLSISTLRFPNVAYEEELKRMYVDTAPSIEQIKCSRAWRNWLFTYVHIDDAADAVRCAIEAGFSGHETFWITAGDTVVDIPSEVLIKEFFPDAERREPLRGFESLISIEKARALLGWEPRRSWRDLRA